MKMIFIPITISKTSQYQKSIHTYIQTILKFFAPQRQQPPSPPNKKTKKQKKLAISSFLKRMMMMDSFEAEILHRGYIRSSQELARGPFFLKGGLGMGMGLG